MQPTLQNWDRLNTTFGLVGFRSLTGAGLSFALRLAAALSRSKGSSAGRRIPATV